MLVQLCSVASAGARRREEPPGVLVLVAGSEDQERDSGYPSSLELGWVMPW